MVAVRQQNVEQLKSILFDVSDPLSSNYGHHLSRNEVDELTIDAEAIQKTLTYLKSHDVEVNILKNILQYL